MERILPFYSTPRQKRGKQIRVVSLESVSIPLNSFGAKFQTTFVACFFFLFFFFFFNNLSLDKEFICKVVRLNAKQRRSRRDGSSGSMLFAKAYYNACDSERVKPSQKYTQFASTVSEYAVQT